MQNLNGIAAVSDESYKWRSMAIVIVGTFMAILDNSIVNVALPHMMASFGTDIETIKWVATAYMMAYGVVVLTTNYLGKRYGQERVYVYALILFTLGSFLCGRAWDINSMIFFRAFQAIGGGLMLPTGMTILTRAFKPSERGMAFGFFGIVIIFGPVLGPTLGGYIVDKVDWHWIFLVNIPVGLVAVPVAFSILRFPPPEGTESFDWIGYIGLSTALTALLLALSKGERWGWTSPSVVLTFALAAVGFFIFVVYDLHVKNPIIDLTIFANTAFSILFTMSFFRAVSLFGRTLFLSLFMQVLMGYSALSAGIYLIPGAIVAGICTPIFGRLSDRIGARLLLVAGSLISALSYWLYHDLSIDAPYSRIFWPMILFGLGMGMMTSPLMSTLMNVVQPRQMGICSILQTAVMQVGGAYGINYLEVFIKGRQAFHLQHQFEAFTGSLYNHAGRWIENMPFVASHSPATLQKLRVILLNQATSAGSAYDDAFVILTVLTLIAAFLACIYPAPRIVGHGAAEPNKELAVEAG
jgi:EmrB/QacA subfamily drug resistance transporter